MTPPSRPSSGAGWALWAPRLASNALRAIAGAGLLLAFVAPSGCSAVADDGEADSALREDTGRAPQTVRVAVRFTRNEVADVGFAFSSSWVPFTDVARDRMDGYSWGLRSPREAEAIAAQIGPDKPGSGYVTATFRLDIPYDRDGQLAYGLTRVRLERDFVRTEIATTVTRAYSSLRIYRGSDQPCLSVTMSGGLEGKLKAIPLPFTDENFTERDWQLGEKDAKGRPIQRVILATLNFAAFCWPENVEGKTHLSAGAGIPGLPMFAMVDKGSGQGDGSKAVVHVNLVENDQGLVSVGETFSTNGGILGERELAAFNRSVAAFRERFVADMKRGAAAHQAAIEAAALGGL